MAVSALAIFAVISILMIVVFFVSSLRKLEKDLLAVKNSAQVLVAKETEKIDAIVNNLQQALFAVGPGGVIVEPVTKYTEKIFGRNIIGENVMQTLYKSLYAKREIYDSVESALVTVMGENELQWDLVESNFPRKIEYLAPDVAAEAATFKLLKINISPIWDNEENLQRLLFVIEDITDFEKMELQFKQEQEQSGMLECVLENTLEDLNVAIKYFQQSSAECRTIAASIDPVSFMDLQRVLHTMKGNARQLKMRVLSDQIHNSETAVMAQMSNIIYSDNGEVILLELDQIDNVIRAHVALIQKFLHSESSWGEAIVPVYKLALEQVQTAVAALKNSMTIETCNQVEAAVCRLEFKSIAALAVKFAPMITDISNEFGKKIDFEIESDALARADQAIALSESLLHLIRNSIDHGIETPDVRAQLGKPETGRIKIFCIDSIDSLTITLSDDGAGVDTNKVAISAIKKGLVSAEQVAEFSQQEKLNLIFLRSVSTKEKISDISGRGIGMDVVKQNIEKMGGHLMLQSEKGKGMVLTIKLYHTDISEKSLKIAA